MEGSPAARFLLLGAGNSRHTISCEIARRLFGGRASHQAVEGRQSEPSSSVAGCGSRWNGPGGGGEDRQHGSPQAARLGSSLQRFRTSSTPHGKAAMGWPAAPRFGNAVAYPFFHSPTFCRHSKVAVSGRGTSTVGAEFKYVCPTGDDYAEIIEHNEAAVRHHERAANSHRTGRA